VDWDDLPGDAKVIKCLNLIMHTARHGRLDELVLLAREQNDGVEWPVPPPAARQVEDEQTLGLSRYRDPLLKAAFDLQSRLWNIARKGFLSIYYRRAETKEYAVKNTLYVIGEYLGWVEMMRQEGQYLDLGDVSTNRRLEEVLRKVSHAFATDSIVDPVFRLFRGEQRAIGEIMVFPQSGEPGQSQRCIGYAEFVAKLDDPGFARWFTRLEGSIDLLVEEHGKHNERLIELQHALIDLVDLIDPEHVHISEKKRGKLPDESAGEPSRGSPGSGESVNTASQRQGLPSPEALASEILAEVRALPVHNAANERALRRKYSRRLRKADGEFVLGLARALLENHGQRWLACELIQRHREAFQLVGESELKEFGRGINSWGSVDGFARILAGPVWLHRQVPDELIHAWARSEDRWWRRAALVSTVALNVKASGGSGDTARTLAVCRLLVADRDDMVVKAMSWALRALVGPDPDAVRAFLSEHEDVLAARVKREVRNKLTTGLKNPKRKAAEAKE
jgi:3-methyladenine DNA glycosylase AlkD